MSRSSARYSTVAIVLHWLIAVLILVNLYLALTFGGLHGYALFKTLQLHKSLGLTVLILSLARLTYRLGHRPRPWPAAMSRWERLVAIAVHWLFYALMIGIPLTGWIVVSASPTNIPTLLFNKVPWPHLSMVHDLTMPVRMSLESRFGQVHEVLGYSMLVLVALHIGAALKHQFLNRDEVLGEMLPFLRRKSPAETA